MIELIDREAIGVDIDALKEMPVEEYRQRLIELFHNTDHDELITLVVMPKDEEFKLLEHILRQYKFEPRLHGEWIESINDNICSVCKQNSLTHWKSPFCPCCGADMRKKEGEAE